MKQDSPFPDLDTPAVLVDLDKLEANISNAQALADAGEVRLRPHSKSHECAEIVRMQLAAGAVGVSSAKIEEAEQMARNGVDDIHIVHPLYGDHKLAKLAKLMATPGLKLTCTVDMVEHATALTGLAQAIGKDIPVLLKIDTGIRRFGVLPGEPALRRALEVSRMPGIELVGIMGHESTHGQRSPKAVEDICHQVATEMSDTATLLKDNGIPIQHVIVGSTTSLRTVPMLKDFTEITEIHPGMYAFGDMMYVSNFAMPLECCSLTVLTTVIGVSESPPARAIIDAGGKTLTPDALIHLRNEPGYFHEDRPRFGHVKQRPDLWFGRLPAENGILYPTDPAKRVALGERLEIIPNNAAMVVAMHDRIYGVRQGAVEKVLEITGRGLGN